MMNWISFWEKSKTKSVCFSRYLDSLHAHLNNTANVGIMCSTLDQLS